MARLLRSLLPLVCLLGSAPAFGLQPAGVKDRLDQKVAAPTGGGGVVHHHQVGGGVVHHHDTTAWPAWTGGVPGPGFGGPPHPGWHYDRWGRRHPNYHDHHYWRARWWIFVVAAGGVCLVVALWLGCRHRREAELVAYGPTGTVVVDAEPSPYRRHGCCGGRCCRRRPHVVHDGFDTHVYH